MTVTIYTLPTCGKCEYIKKRLNELNIQYIEEKDEKVLQDKGFVTVPKLEVNGVIKEFSQILSWLKTI